MKVHQLSVFLENQPGHLSRCCKALADAGINILTLSLADTQQFGILRLIVRDWEKGKAELEKMGAVVKVTEVVATEVGDRPGGLYEILAVLEEGGINVEYMYAFTFRREQSAVMVFRFEDPDKAIELLRSKGINVLNSVELYDLVEK